MEKIKIYPEKSCGKFKILNATNGGPWHKRHATDQARSNFEAYKAARIPYARNHDSADCGIYGGPYSHDITRLFPNFDADPYDPEAYDFACTDESILISLEAGTKTFFRLGQTIEHQIKKHGTVPPKDFNKWAVICEHVIRHYNEGWADGFNLNIEYWEIWNEPDLDKDDSTNKRTWGGTKAQFFDLYEIAAKHLKSCFPNLKIGGPAICGDVEWGRDFLQEMQRRNVPLDFFSWHQYARDPKDIAARSIRVREIMNEAGYEKAESILNEWNYIRGWEETYIYSLQMIRGVKGAAFIMATISESQYLDIDMLMYYDTRPSSFCGVFDTLTYKPIKGYFPIFWYGECYDFDRSVAVESSSPEIYVLAGVDQNGKRRAFVTYYSENDYSEDKKVSIDFGGSGTFAKYVLDDTHDGDLEGNVNDLTFTLKVNSCIMLQEV